MVFRCVAGPSETPHSLSVPRSLVEEVKRGKENELRVWDGGQVEQEDIFALRDIWDSFKTSHGVSVPLTVALWILTVPFVHFEHIDRKHVPFDTFGWR